jgi:hypothetical protein
MRRSRCSRLGSTAPRVNTNKKPFLSAPTRDALVPIRRTGTFIAQVRSAPPTASLIRRSTSDGASTSVARQYKSFLSVCVEHSSAQLSYSASQVGFNGQLSIQKKENATVNLNVFSPSHCPDIYRYRSSRVHDSGRGLSFDILILNQFPVLGFSKDFGSMYLFVPAPRAFRSEVDLSRCCFDKAGAI